MADFCNICSKEMFGDVNPDINVHQILEELDSGFFTSVLCEGCGMSHIGKEEDGTPFFYFDYVKKVEDRKYSLEEWESGKMKCF
jgi:hypothetical protein